MKKLMLLAVVAIATASVCGCNGSRVGGCGNLRGHQSTPCSSSTAYDPATPYIDGGYMVPPSGINELPPPGPVSMTQ